MKLVVTGAAGFIGANLIAGLNRRGIDDVIAVDDLTDGSKFRNLAGLRISDYFDRAEFYERFRRGELGKVDAVLHEGACSDTMVGDGRYMVETNYRCSKTLLDACTVQGCRFLYASSAAIYGDSPVFREEEAHERPLNVYGYSKLLFDQVVRRHLSARSTPQVVGFRYFNVYGPREQHKTRMASVAFHHMQQFRRDGRVRLFGEYGGYGPGCQERDFVYVDDVVAVKLWFLDRPQVSGIFNVGTGRSQPFNDIAHATVNAFRALQREPALTLKQQVEQGLIEYIPFPDDLRGKYQCRTQADLTRLRQVGCDHRFVDVGTGIRHYLQSVSEQGLQPAPGHIPPVPSRAPAPAVLAAHAFAR